MIVNIKKGVRVKTKKIKSNYSKTKKEILAFFKEKGKLKKIKKLLNYLWKNMKRKEILIILLLIIPFIIIDIATRLFGISITFYSIFNLTPRLFSIAYIVLLLGVCLNIKSNYGKIIYSVIYFLSVIMFLVHNIYYETMGSFFSFSLLSLAGEGSDYFLDAIRNCNIMVYFVFALLIIMYIFVLKYYPKSVKYNKKKIIKYSCIFLVLHLISKLLIGSGNIELTWDTWRNPRNVYNNFNDSNKCMTLTGFYEYNLRDFYITYIKPKEKKSDTESKFLNDVFEEDVAHRKNKYTGKFKDKNVIFLQLEGIDDWLLTKDIMPNTYSLLNNSLVFTNHYSYYNGGGSTFNSEFMVNTGYTTPYTYPMNAYSLNKNDFPYSMANLMKQKDYSIKAYHMNTKEYYSRGINYFNWGYDNYLGLKDLGTYQNNEYHLDRELILNETFYDELFKSTGKFINYIITYSNHLPFSSGKGVCRDLIKMDYADTFIDMTNEEVNDFITSLDMSEEDCIKRQAKETDEMVGLLIKGLKDNNLYNNTVIFAFADHYLYTVSDTEILKNNGKKIDNNLINHTPFFIFSAGMKKQEIKKTTSQINILPTFLNLMGITYNDKWYIGSDVLADDYKSMVIFNDLSWYDGKYYVEDGVVTNSLKFDSNWLESMNSYMEYLVKKNDLVLKYNYFKENELKEDIWKK